MVKSLRGMDSAVEAEISKFMDKYFYPVHTINFQRAADYDSQMSGIDTRFSYQELQNIRVDEKAATHYINCDLPTFAFELSFLVNGDLIPGWFYDESKKTEYYLLQWVTAKKDKNLVCDDIIAIDSLLIERNRIIRMLASYGYPKERVLNTAFRIRKKNLVAVSGKEKNRPFYFFFSHQLAEQPVNLIIRKEELVNLAHSRFNVRPA